MFDSFLPKTSYIYKDYDFSIIGCSINVFHGWFLSRPRSQHLCLILLVWLASRSDSEMNWEAAYADSEILISVPQLPSSTKRVEVRGDGMEQGLLKQIEKMNFRTQMEVFYTAYSKVCLF